MKNALNWIFFLLHFQIRNLKNLTIRKKSCAENNSTTMAAGPNNPGSNGSSEKNERKADNLGVNFDDIERCSTPDVEKGKRSNLKLHLIKDYDSSAQVSRSSSGSISTKASYHAKVRPFKRRAWRKKKPGEIWLTSQQRLLGRTSS